MSSFNLKDIEHSANVIIWDNNKKQFVWNDIDFKNCFLNLDMPPPDLLDIILEKVGSRAKEASRVEIPFNKMVSINNMWQKSSCPNLSLPIGKTGDKIQYLELGKRGGEGGMAHHCLVVGKPGSGKSTLLHDIIVASGLIYSPEEIELYLIDFKEGVEFETYAKHNMPHARVVSIETDREFGLSVLKELQSIKEQRGKLFKSVHVPEISDYRQKTNKIMSRILLLVDEFHKFFETDDTIANDALEILDDLIRQGRNFGIHTILSSQTLAGIHGLPRSTVDLIGVRIALQCSDADSRYILSDDNGAARLLSRSGEAIYNATNGLVKGNNLFQVAWISKKERDAYLQGIQNISEIQHYAPPRKQIVYVGNTLAELRNNSILHGLLKNFPKTPILQEVPIWLGEPIELKAPTVAQISRQTGNNLLVLGQIDTMAIGILFSSLIALASQYKKNEAHFYIVVNSIGKTISTELFNRLSKIIPHQVEVVDQSGLIKLFNKVAENVTKRKNAEIEISSENQIELFLVIVGLQRVRNLNEEDLLSDNSYGDEDTHVNSSKQFATILAEGPEVGIHTLVWCDGYKNFTRKIGMLALREFDMRIALKMNIDDSNNLINDSTASKLGQFNALYLSANKGGQPEKFKPYGLPTEDWLTWIEKEFHKS
jgi:hypothetical protein